MTRDAEHTPNGYEDAASVGVNQAPAPSSLAGGSVGRLSALLSSDHLRGDYPIAGLGAVSWNDLRAILAALSPEAPAREGVEPWKEGREEGCLAARPWRKGDPVPAVGTMVLVSGAHGDIESDQHRAFQWRRVIGYGVDGADFICLQNKGCWPTVERMENCWFAALRDRSSAPEAREGEARKVEWVNDASNVNDRRMYIDGRQWAKVYGWDKASLDARCDALQVAMQRPDAPSADKLRIAAEALEPFAQAGRDLYPDDADTMRPAVVQAVHFRAAAKALAALKAEG